MGYLGETSSLVFYVEEQNFDDDEVERFKAGGITLRAEESKAGRVKLMLEDIRTWAIENPVEGNLMVAGEEINDNEEIKSALKGYKVCYVHDDESAKWLSISLNVLTADLIQSDGE